MIILWPAACINKLLDISWVLNSVLSDISIVNPAFLPFAWNILLYPFTFSMCVVIAKFLVNNLVLIFVNVFGLENLIQLHFKVIIDEWRIYYIVLIVFWLYCKTFVNHSTIFIIWVKNMLMTFTLLSVAMFINNLIHIGC